MNTMVYLTIQIYTNYIFPVRKLRQKNFLKEHVLESTSGKIAILVSFISLGLIMYAYGLF